MARWLIPVGLAIVTSVGMHAACSASNDVNQATGGSGTTTTSTSSDIGLDGGDIDLDACAGAHCSADLHTLVDCSGNVVMTCPDDQGCSGTSCVPACASASDNKSTFGCDYYAIGPDIIFDGAGACFAAFVVNTWTTPVGVTVDYEGQQLDVTKFAYIPSGSGASIQYKPLTTGQIPPGEVAILFLNRFGFNPLGLVTDCPLGVTPAIVTKDTAPHGTTLGSAFHIATTAPVVSYDIYPYGGGQSALTSATLLLPTSASDTNCVAVDAYGPGIFGGPFIAIVAQEDGTQVTVNPSADIAASPTVAGTPKGTPAKYDLARGQVLQFTQPTPLAGSVIQSNVPVGVWGGKTN
ncbi:MAG: IgGFc-binding protein, partial [Phycisphaerales bacterium]|nr:IgGFc-binding protein [Phycisphaerales bacterium]